MYDYKACCDCDYYMGEMDQIIYRDGKELTLKKGFCSYQNRVTYPSFACNINWCQEAWIQRHLKEAEDNEDSESD